MKVSQMALLGAVAVTALGMAAWMVAENPRPLYRAGDGPLAERPDTRVVQADARSARAEALEIVFVRLPGDSLRVEMSGDGRSLREFGPLEGGFMRGVLRPLERERVRSETPLSAPYRVVRDPAGRLTLQDVGSNLEIDLAAFGPTSHALFSSLLDGEDAPPVPPLFTTN